MTIDSSKAFSLYDRAYVEPLIRVKQTVGAKQIMQMCVFGVTLNSVKQSFQMWLIPCTNKRINKN
jgi:hypothetical protein